MKIMEFLCLLLLLLLLLLLVVVIGCCYQYYEGSFLHYVGYNAQSKIFIVIIDVIFYYRFEYLGCFNYVNKVLSFCIYIYIEREREVSFWTLFCIVIDFILLLLLLLLLVLALSLTVDPKKLFVDEWSNTSAGAHK